MKNSHLTLVPARVYGEAKKQNKLSVESILVKFTAIKMLIKDLEPQINNVSPYQMHLTRKQDNLLKALNDLQDELLTEALGDHRE